VGSGGVPPFGQDFNGILNQITQWSQWEATGGLPKYDNAFSTAIGGYPAGALLASTTAGRIWINTTDNNTVDPDGAGTGWVSLTGSASTWAGTFGGSGNALTATLTPALTAYTASQIVRGIVGTTNAAGATTLNVNGLGNKAVVRPGGANLLPGDLTIGQVAEFIYDGTSFELLNLNGRAGVIFAQGQLLYTSTTVVTLTPYKGNLITFPSGAVAQIPSAGITSTINSAYLNGTASSTLSASTLYYAYLWNQGSVAVPNYVIDWSTTGHATDAATGIEIKSGDATRVLIGMAYPKAGPVFADSATDRLVATWNNRRPRNCQNSYTTTRTTNSGTFVEVNSEIRCNFITWGDAVWVGSSIAASCSGNISAAGAISLDGLLTAGNLLSTSYTPNAGGVLGDLSSAGTFAPAEGFHYTTIMGATTSGTMTMQWPGAGSFIGSGYNNAMTVA